jgi:hypothetical protein
MLALSSCGGSGARRAPALAELPILPGAHVSAQARACDQGAAAYCAIQLVIVDPQFTNNRDFLLAERKWLHEHGWTGAGADVGGESAADSPGHTLHLVYATANADLEGWDFDWIKREAPVIYALSNSVFDGTAALSMMLEVGSGSL